MPLINIQTNLSEDMLPVDFGENLNKFIATLMKKDLEVKIFSKC
jgi:hypothetical protein